MSCTELMNFVPILEKLAYVRDVRQYLPAFTQDNKVDFAKAKAVLGLESKVNPEDESEPVKPS